jgi:hypothetical protein
MGNQSLIPERFFAELDRLGVAAVCQRLAAGAWGKAGQKAKLARLWLADNDRRKEGADPLRQASRSIAPVASERSDPFTPRDAARLSADAAERSADDAEAALAIARDANFRAALALAIAAASLIVHLMLVFVRSS